MFIPRSSIELIIALVSLASSDVESVSESSSSKSKSPQSSSSKSNPPNMSFNASSSRCLLYQFPDFKSSKVFVKIFGPELKSLIMSRMLDLMSPLDVFASAIASFVSETIDLSTGAYSPAASPTAYPNDLPTFLT